MIESLEEAKQHIRDNAQKGTECPCCGQNVKFYRRKLNSIMARGLISLYEQRLKQPIHISKIKLGDREVTSMGGSFALLWHWGLVITERNDHNHKRCSGLWNITDKGIDFVLNRLYVPESGIFYNNKVMEWLPEQLNIIDALGNKHDYQQMVTFKQQTLL